VSLLLKQTENLQILTSAVADAGYTVTAIRLMNG
jgi:hypothetical protein